MYVSLAYPIILPLLLFPKLYVTSLLPSSPHRNQWAVQRGAGLSAERCSLLWHLLPLLRCRQEVSPYEAVVVRKIDRK